MGYGSQFTISAPHRYPPVDACLAAILVIYPFLPHFPFWGIDVRLFSTSSYGKPEVVSNVCMHEDD